MYNKKNHNRQKNARRNFTPRGGFYNTRHIKYINRINIIASAINILLSVFLVTGLIFTLNKDLAEYIAEWCTLMFYIAPIFAAVGIMNIIERYRYKKILIEAGDKGKKILNTTIPISIVTIFSSIAMVFSLMMYATK